MAAQQQGDTLVDAPIDFHETATPEWTDDGEQWIADGRNRWWRNVTCPQCHGPFPVVHEPLYKAVDAPPSAAWIDVRCICQTAHAPHKAGEGCGWIGQVLFSPPSNRPQR